MDIFMKNVSIAIDELELTEIVAQVLHTTSTYQKFSKKKPVNFRVTLFPDKDIPGQHRGIGLITLGTEELGELILSDWDSPRWNELKSRSPRIIFRRGNKAADQRVVAELQSQPYSDPKGLREDRNRHGKLKQGVAISRVQFGWECRDGSFSVEWEDGITNGRLEFSDQRDEICAVLPAMTGSSSKMISIRYASIRSMGIEESSHSSALYVTMSEPPMFSVEDVLSRSLTKNSRATRQQVSYLDEAHKRVAPYTSLAVRYVFKEQVDLHSFRELCRLAKLRTNKYHPPLVARGLFSAKRLAKISQWQCGMKFQVAYQCETILTHLLLDPVELISLIPYIEGTVRERGPQLIALTLQSFHMHLKSWKYALEDKIDYQAHILSLFRRSLTENQSQSRPLSYTPESGLFDCFHLMVTPTARQLRGPYPERSNQVIRRYKHYEGHFLRITFTDEKYHRQNYDPDINRDSYLLRRVCVDLSQGIMVAGRRFEFLAYTMSGLREHSAWLVEPFVDGGKLVDSAAIRNNLGNFDRVLEFPSLYAARLSQAFTCTEASVTVEADQLREIDDIKCHGMVYSDGVGTISPELADELWKSQRKARKRISNNVVAPRAFQIRLAGAKGMLSVDYRLNGRVICLRPSMTKFASPSRAIDVAQCFNKPFEFLLNRPLVMILEGLGVKAENFLKLQHIATDAAKSAMTDLNSAARFMDQYGLGGSFHIPSVWIELDRLGLKFSPTVHMEYLLMSDIHNNGLHHLLRDLKYQARIPVADSYSLVGIADEHHYLHCGEVYACIQKSISSNIIYLEGECIITRSPVIHPGDVQKVRAIGRPPPNSPFGREPLTNTVVFNVKDKRPLPSCLGGGDLDGDIYNLIFNKVLHPPTIHPPADYEDSLDATGLPREKYKRLQGGRKTTISDVLDFFTEYIKSDVVGPISTNWLKIADMSPKCIFDDNCLTLARLHSIAVDYPKRGIPVDINKIPHPQSKLQPDWSATEFGPNHAGTYQSQRALGKLYRDITLSEVPRVSTEKHIKTNSTLIEKILLILKDSNHKFDDPISTCIYSAYPQLPFHLSLHLDSTMSTLKFVSKLFEAFQSSLYHLCQNCSLSGRHSMLQESEVLSGTILAKALVPRKRTDLMLELREKSLALVSQITNELSGDETTPSRVWFERTWIAWCISNINFEKKVFGSASFGYIALASLFRVAPKLQAQLSPLVTRTTCK